MVKEEQVHRLAYWLAAYQCRVLTADQISAELDQLILELGEETPGAFIDLAWDITKEERDFLHIMDDTLWTLGFDCRQPISREQFWRLRRAIREKWEVGEWNMGECLDRLYRLTFLYNGPEWRDLVDICTVYEEMVEDGYGTAEQVAEWFIKVIYEELESLEGTI